MTEENINNLKGLELDKEAEDKERQIISNIIGDVDDELAKCEQMFKYRGRITPCLRLLDVLCSDSEAIYINGNTIIHNNKENRWETLIIKKPLKEGIYRITFKRVGKTPVVFGIIKAKSGCPSSKLNLSDSDDAIGITVEDTFKTNVVNFFKNETTVEFAVALTASLATGTFIASPILGGAFGCGIRVKNNLLNKVDFNTTIKNKEGKEISGCARIEDKDDVTLELNLLSDNPSKRTMHYFVNYQQSPVIITGLPNELYFAVSLRDKDSKVEFINILELGISFTVVYEKMIKVEWLKSVDSE